MRAAVYLLLIGMLWSAGGVQAQAKGEAEAVTVPLILRGVHIFVEATINDQPALLWLDTGANLIVLTPAAAKRLNLTLEKSQINVQGVGDDKAKASTIKIEKLGVGAAVLKTQHAYVLPLLDAVECDGVLGTPFFREWVVQIDFVKLQMTLTPRDRFQPPTDATALPIQFYNGLPAVEATEDGIKGWFHIDTGADDAVTLFGLFVEHHHLRGKYTPSLRTMTGEGVGGVTHGDMVRLPDFGIGSFHWTRVTADLSLQTEGAFADKVCAGNLGAEIWRRFVLTLDYQHKKIFLARNTQYDEPFLGIRAGIDLDEAQKPVLVRSVIPTGPAAEAGIQEGDVVLAVNGKPMEQIKSSELDLIFRAEVGTKIVLHLRAKDNTERDATITLRELY